MEGDWPSFEKKFDPTAKSDMRRKDRTKQIAVWHLILLSTYAAAIHSVRFQYIRYLAALASVSGGNTSGWSSQDEQLS